MSLVARCTGFDEFEYPLYDLSGLGFFSPGFGFLCSLPQASPTQQPLCVILRAQRYRQSLPDEMARPTIDIDEQIDRLRAGGTLTENEVKALCEKVRRTCGDRTGSALRPTPPLGVMSCVLRSVRYGCRTPRRYAWRC